MGRHHALKPSHIYTSFPSHSLAPFSHLLKPATISPTAIFQSSSISALSVGDRIPGFKVSAAFLSNLHSNIFIELDAAYDSADDNPHALQPTVAHFAPTPLVRSMSSLTDADTAPPEALKLPETADDVEEESGPKEPVVGEDGIPLLKTFPAEDDDMRAEALHIVADSVAQQRNMASRALIFHPLSLAAFVLAFGLIRQAFYQGQGTDYIKILTTFTGVVMAILGAIRLACGPYIFEAERVGTWNWLNEGRSPAAQQDTGLRVLGDSDQVLLTKFGRDYIGAIIFRGVQPVNTTSSSGGNKRTRRAQSPSKHTKMVIRAWSVAQKYRRKEVGSALLEDAIRIGMDNGWTMGGIEFAEDHANHKRVLPALFNGPLDKYTRIAQKTLDKKVQALTQEKGRKRK